MRSTNQKERLQKVKQGAGTFVYQGGACDTEAVPGEPLIGKDGHQVVTVPLITVQDADGKSVTVADPKGGGKGQPVWKKAPKFIRTEMKVFKMAVPGVVGEIVDGVMVAKPLHDGTVPALFLEFEKGKSVHVADSRMALKLRCLKFFKEVDGGAEPEAKPAKAVESKAAKGEAKA